ncbi:MAG: hypothetical protein HZB50_08515 [Chloroflexi bacterium]|nr:hypothetical protein [Chloroflexota bacterium]
MENINANQARTIHNISELAELARWSNLLAIVGNVKLELPGLTKEKKSEYENLVGMYTHACGCEEVRIFLVSLLAIYGIRLYLNSGGTLVFGWSEFGTGFGLMCVGAVIGKLFGLIRARIKLRALVTNIGLDLQA